MSEIFPEKPPIRCSGCGFSHQSCERQVAAERMVHRLAELLDFQSKTAVHGPTPGVMGILDEYRLEWE